MTKNERIGLVFAKTGSINSGTEFINPEGEFLNVIFSPLPEFIDPVFAKTSQKRSFLKIENERFGLVFAKTGYINSGNCLSVQIALEIYITTIGVHWCNAAIGILTASRMLGET